MTTIGAFDDISTIIPPPREEPELSDAELGQQDFLTLMITQFQNQDPFQPMENGEFLGQIAQFSTVNGIDELNAGFSSLAASLQDEQALQAAALVGRDVIVEANSGYRAADDALRGSVDLDDFASDVQIDIRDASGEVVQTLALGSQTAGIVDFSWNGTNLSGEPMPAGTYSLEARVLRGSQVESAQTLVEARVNSVTLGRNGGGMTLNLEGGSDLPLNRIFRIN